MIQLPFELESAVETDVPKVYVFLFSTSICPDTISSPQRLPREADAYCWVVGDEPLRAALWAMGLIRRAGWDPDDLLDARSVDREDYEDDVRALRFFDEAVETGSSLVIWPHSPAGSIPCPIHPTAP